MYFVFDIGATKMRMASSVDGVRLSSTKIIPTPPDFESSIVHIENYLNENSAEGKEVICCGLPGVLDKDKTKLVGAGHLPFWINKPIKVTLEDSTGSKVFLENDASLAALGETIRGAGMGKDIVGFLTFGTGVGGARVVDGKIDRYTVGFEPGHQIIDTDGTVASIKGTLDALTGGAGIEKRFGKKGEDIRDPHTWMDIEKLIAVGVVNTTLFWSPEIIVLGGSLIKNEFLSIRSIEEYAKETLKIYPQIPDIKIGILGDHAGLIGALEYIKQQLFPIL